MSYLLLGSFLGVVSYAIVGVAASLVVILAWRTWGRAIDGLSPRRRAEVLLMIRLFPVAAGALATVGVFARAYVLFEPRDTRESVGAVLLILALAAMILAVRAPVAALRSWRKTNELTRNWLRGSEPVAVEGAPAPTHLVDTAFPVVTVVGLRKPSILMARSVRGACTDNELAAMLAHEGAHIASRDNLKRLMMRAAPDPLVWTRVGDELERAWSEASEEAADEHAPESLSMSLASALVKVARLAVGVGPKPAVLTALYQSGPIARRVERLAGNRERPSRRHRSLLPLAVVLSISAVASIPPGFLQKVHAVTEAVVVLLQ